mmetsp:Transcript_83766/g.115578  ORF Transcript_83766/g.115578 Transcript_83766/m.115578 type:complete len:332 (+) Transcript_83766:107-1102(+)
MPGNSRSGQRSPKRATRDWADLYPASSSFSLSPLMPISIAGKSLVMKGTNSIFMAWGMASDSSRKPRRTFAFSSKQPASISHMSSADFALSIFSKTSDSAREAPSCSPISPSRSFLNSHGWFCSRERSGSTCSMMPKALAASRCTSATGSVSAACSMGTTAFRKGFMHSTSWTSMEVEPKICADHFLLALSRSFRPRITTGMRSDRDAGSMSDRNVWLPILASTAWVCFWLVGSVRAVMRSCDSFLISGLATQEPISRSTALVPSRISLRTSSAASASFGTTSGKQAPICAGVCSSCFMQGSNTSMQLALTFHFLSSMPWSRAGITTDATP